MVSKPKINSKNKFGTFSGVFTPSILTILGVIMFMRTSFVIGEVGIIGAIVILIIAKSITVLTTLSVGAISTNMDVKGGGAYFMISRVLGPEFGGAIGIVLFFAQSLSVPFYILGFAEALILSFPQLTPHFQLIAYITAIILFFVSFVGAEWAIKMQFFIMTILGLSIFSFMSGSIINFSSSTFWQNIHSNYTTASPGHTYNFWIIFALFFPAVTGILAGINMSGDLENPSQSITNGTLYAILVGFIIYLTQIIVTGGAFSRIELIETPFEILKNCAIFNSWYLVVAGVFAATISSALGSFLGAPRILQAVSRDNIIDSLKPFAKGSSKGDEPIRALLFTGVITIFTIYLSGGKSGGDALNIVASIISMFFLYTYGMINLAAFIEAYGTNPSFRPTFKYFSWHTALLGGLGCIGVAILIDFKAAIIAIILIIILLKILNRKKLNVKYGDARRGFLFARIKENLIKLKLMKSDIKNWRPTILLFSGNPNTRKILVDYAAVLEANRGIIFIANVITASIDNFSSLRPSAMKQLEKYCAEKSIDAFPYVMLCEKFEDGMTSLIQTAGIYPIIPNIVMLGWGPDYKSLSNILRKISLLKKSTIILKKGSNELSNDKIIDIWWRGKKNGGMMIVLAHLMKATPLWKDAQIRLLREVENSEGADSATIALENIIKKARVEATARVIVSSKPFPSLLREVSSNSNVVFLGFKTPESGLEESWYNSYSIMLKDFPPTTILLNSEEEENILE